MSVRDTPAPGLTVLVVDDEEPVRALTARMLVMARYRVATASDGIEALDAIRRAASPVGIVVTDLRMPRMDGSSLATNLALLHPAPKFVFISGHPGTAPDITPGSAFVAKPFGAVELLAAVQAVLPVGGIAPVAVSG